MPVYKIIGGPKAGNTYYSTQPITRGIVIEEDPSGYYEPSVSHKHDFLIWITPSQMVERRINTVTLTAEDLDIPGQSVDLLFSEVWGLRDLVKEELVEAGCYPETVEFEIEDQTVTGFGLAVVPISGVSYSDLQTSMLAAPRKVTLNRSPRDAYKNQNIGQTEYPPVASEIIKAKFEAELREDKKSVE